MPHSAAAGRALSRAPARMLSCGDPMMGIKLGWTMRLGLALCAVVLLAFNWAIRQVPDGGPADPVSIAEDTAAPGPTRGSPDDPLLENESWHIRNMATAHGAFVIEVEADDPTQSEAIARALVEPIKDDYAEVLVYVNQRGDDSDLPARRMQWTAAEGYVEISYEQDPDSR